MAKRIIRNLGDDGIDRRGFLECMAWAGSGLLWTISGGIAYSQMAHRTTGVAQGSLSFVQISDSHMGFNKEANKDVAATLQEAVAKINALPDPPLFVIHTGDISHLSKPSEFDTVDQILKSAKISQIFYVPGEHDGLGDNGKLYLERYGKGTNGLGWYSFDQKGVHFVGLVNVFDLKPGGLGLLGDEQLRWLEKDLAPYSNSTPIVLFAHIPLWSVYPSGAGAPTTVPRHCRMSSDSVRSRSSMAIFIRYCRRWKAVYTFTRPHPPHFHSPLPVLRRTRGQ